MDFLHVSLTFLNANSFLQQGQIYPRASRKNLRGRRKVKGYDGKDQLFFSVDMYIYYWYWGAGRGENWMIGESFRSSAHNVESRNLQNAGGRNKGYCVTDINRTGFPFSVYSNNGVWTRDTYLRIECLLSEKPCCERVALVSRGLAQTHQPARIGIYRAEALRNARYFYVKEGGGSFIYYWDWGPNRGANWVITNDPNDGSNRGIESANVEYGVLNNTLCFNEARRAGMFSVFNGRDGQWDTDRSLRVLCDPN